MVYNGRYDLLQDAYRVAPDILNNKNPKGQTLLHVAAAAPENPNSTQIVNFLIDTVHLNIEDVTTQGRTAAFFAAECGNLAVLKALSAHGANLELKAPIPGTNRCISVREIGEIGRAPAKREAIVNFIDSQIKKPIDPLALLHAAIANNDLTEVKRWLPRLRNPADINQYFDCYQFNGTALSRAAAEGNINIAKYLVEQKADVEKGGKMDDSLVTPAMIATVRGKANFLGWLFKEGGANPNATDAYGQTPLFHSLQIQEKDSAAIEPCIKSLLEAKAEDRARTDGSTVLLIATALNNDKAVAALLKDGKSIDPNRKAEGVAPFLRSVRFNHLQTTRVFLGDPRVDREVFDQKGWPATHIALGHNTLDMLQLLLQFGVSPNQTLEQTKCASLGALAIWLNRYDVWRILKKHSVQLVEKYIFIILGAALELKTTDIKFLRELFTTYRNQLGKLTELFEEDLLVSLLAKIAIENGYGSLVPLFMPELKSLTSEEQEKIIASKSLASLGLDVSLLELGETSPLTDLSSVTKVESAVRRGVSGRQHLQNLGVPIAQIKQMLEEYKNKKTESVLSSASSVTLLGQETAVRDCSWFNGQLDSKSSQIFQVEKAANTFVYIDPALSALAKQNPKVDALIAKSRWKMSDEDGIKSLATEFKTMFRIKGQKGKGVPVKLSYEITSRSRDLEHQRILLFSIPADNNQRGVLFIATAGLLAEEGLGESAYRAPDYVEVTLPKVESTPSVKSTDSFRHGGS